MRVQDILKTKGDKVHTIDPDALIGEAATVLQSVGVGALVVSRDGRRIDGILSERDIVRGFARQGANITHLHVSDLMTRNVITCCGDDAIAKVAGTMTAKRIRHLPVCDADVLVGVVSIGDVLKSRIDEVQLEANVLRDVAIAAR